MTITDERKWCAACETHHLYPAVSRPVEVEPDSPEWRRLGLALADPGAFVRRGDNYRESLVSWQLRAVLAAGFRAVGGDC